MNDNDIVTSVTPKNTTITLQPIPEQLLTVKDVAKLLKCNVATVHKLRRAGVIRFLKLGAYKMPGIYLPAISGRLRRKGPERIHP